jgi:hypothetical protein
VEKFPSKTKQTLFGKHSVEKLPWKTKRNLFGKNSIEKFPRKNKNNSNWVLLWELFWIFQN